MVSLSPSSHQVDSNSNPQHLIDLEINSHSPSSIKTNSIIKENLESTSVLHLDPALYERPDMSPSRQPALAIGKSPLNPPCIQPSGSGHSSNPVQTMLMPNSSLSRSAAAPSLQSMLVTPNCSPASPPVVVSGSIPTNSMKSTIPMPTRGGEAQNRDTTSLKQAQEQGLTVSPADRPAPGFCYSPPVIVSIGILPVPSPTLFGIPFSDGFSCAQRAQVSLFRPNVEDSDKPMVLPPRSPENHQRPTPNPSSTKVPARRRSVVIDLTGETSPSASSIEFVEPVSKNRPNPAVSTKLSRPHKLGPEAGSSRGIHKPVPDSSSRTGHHPSPRDRSKETSLHGKSAQDAVPTGPSRGQRLNSLRANISNRLRALDLVVPPSPVPTSDPKTQIESALPRTTDPYASVRPLQVSCEEASTCTLELVVDRQMAVSPTKLCSPPPAPYQSLPHSLKSPRLTTTEQASRGSSRPSSSGSSISSHLSSLKSEAQAKAVKAPIFDPDRFTRTENQDWLTSLKESFDVTQWLDFPQLGDQFETSRDFKRVCLLASWLRGHSMHVWHNRTNGLVTTYSLACSKVHRPPKGVSCSFRITAVCDKTKPTGHRTWKVTDAILQHCNHDPQPGDYDLCGAEQRCQPEALAGSIVSRTSKPESDASSGKHGVRSSTSGLVEKGSGSQHILADRESSRETVPAVPSTNNQVDKIQPEPTASGEAIPAIVWVATTYEQANETLPDPAFLDVAVVPSTSIEQDRGHIQINSPTGAVEQKTRFPSIEFEMTVPPAEPPAPQTPLRPTDLGLATNKQMSLESSKSPCSSPLTSLMSESESESEEVKPQRSEMKKSKRSENLEWYASLQISSDMTEMRDYPVLGDQFKSAREFERACLMASWPRGHSMHIRNITQSAARTKRVFSCVKDRHPPRGVSCPFRISVTCDESKPVDQQTWQVTDAVLLHQNHNPQPGDYVPPIPKGRRQQVSKRFSSSQPSKLETGDNSKNGGISIHLSTPHLVEEESTTGSQHTNSRILANAEASDQAHPAVLPGKIQNDRIHSESVSGAPEQVISGASPHSVNIVNHPEIARNELESPALSTESGETHPAIPQSVFQADKVNCQPGSSAGAVVQNITGASLDNQNRLDHSIRYFATIKSQRHAVSAEPLSPPPQSTGLELTTSERVSVGFPSPASSPLTSLMSDSDAEADKPQRLDQKRSVISGKRAETREWYLSLQNSSDIAEMTNYPALGDRFESTREFERACLLASWPRGHSMHVRSNLETISNTKLVFACWKDRHPPRGVSCPFRIAVTFDKFRPADQQTWQVTDLVLEHRNHNPQPGEYKPHSRKFQKGLDAYSLLASPLERGRGPRAVQQRPSSQSSRPARLLPSSERQTRSHSIDFQQASPSATHLSRLIVQTGNEDGRAESGRSKRKRDSSEDENGNAKRYGRDELI